MLNTERTVTLTVLLLANSFAVAQVPSCGGMLKVYPDIYPPFGALKAWTATYADDWPSNIAKYTAVSTVNTAGIYFLVTPSGGSSTRTDGTYDQVQYGGWGVTVDFSRHSAPARLSAVMYLVSPDPSQADATCGQIAITIVQKEGINSLDGYADDDYWDPNDPQLPQYTAVQPVQFDVRRSIAGQIVRATDISPSAVSTVEYDEANHRFSYSYEVTHLKSDRRHRIALFGLTIASGLKLIDSGTPQGWICLPRPGRPIPEGIYSCAMLHDDGMAQGTTAGPFMIQTDDREFLPGIGNMYVQSNQIHDRQHFSIEDLPPDQEAQVMEQMSLEKNSVSLPIIVPKIRIDEQLREHVSDELISLSAAERSGPWKSVLRDIALKLASGTPPASLVTRARSLPANSGPALSLRNAIVVDLVYLSAHGY